MIRIASSLTNRIFLAWTLLATVSLGFAFAFVNARVSAEAEAELRRGLAEAGTLVDQRRAEPHRHVQTHGAAHRRPAEAESGGRDRRRRPTVQPLADEYRGRSTPTCWCSPIRAARVLASSGDDADSRCPGWAITPKPLDEISTFVPHRARPAAGGQRADRLLDGDPPRVLGRLTRRVLPGRPAGRAVQGADRQRDRVRGRRHVLASSLPRATARRARAACLTRRASRHVIARRRGVPGAGAAAVGATDGAG